MTEADLFKMDLYQVLNIKQEATDQEIQRAYRGLALKWHPDKNPAPEAADKFKLIKAAYDILSDYVKRTEYNWQYFRKPSHGRPTDTDPKFPYDFRPETRYFDAIEKLIRSLTTLPKEKRLDELFKTDTSGNTFLHRMNEMQITKVFEYLLPKEDYISALLKKKKNGDTVLDYVFQTMSLEVVNTLLLLLEPNDRYSVLTQTSIKPKDLPLSSSISIMILIHSYPSHIRIQEIIDSNRFKDLGGLVDFFANTVAKMQQNELLKIAESGVYESWGPSKRSVFFKTIIKKGLSKEKLQSLQNQIYFNDLLDEMFTSEGFEYFQKQGISQSEQVDILFMLSTMELPPSLLGDLERRASKSGLFFNYELLVSKPKEVVGFISKFSGLELFTSKNMIRWLESQILSNSGVDSETDLIEKAFRLLWKHDQQELINKNLTVLDYSSKSLMAIILNAACFLDRIEICKSVQFQQKIISDPSWFILGLDSLPEGFFRREYVERYMSEAIKNERYFQLALFYLETDISNSKLDTLIRYFSKSDMLELVRKNPLRLADVLASLDRFKPDNDVYSNYIKDLFNSSTWDLASFKIALNEVIKAKKLNWALVACNPLYISKESVTQIVQTFYSNDQYALHNALFNKLIALSKRKQTYKYHGLFKNCGAFSREEKIEAITNFLMKKPLSEQNKKALLQGETGKIIRQNKTPDVMNLLKKKEAPRCQKP